MGAVGGDLALTAQGPAAALDLTADAGLTTPAGPVTLATGARLDAPGQRLALQRLETQVRGETLRLLAPALLDFSDGLAVVSLFAEDFNASRHTREVTQQIGATHTLTRQVHNAWITVVGDVPAVTAHNFSSALKRRTS